MGHPTIVFLDHKGRVLATGNLTRNKKEDFDEDYARAKWAFDIYRAVEKEPESTVAKANATLLDLYLGRTVPPLSDLASAATADGVDTKLAAHYKNYVTRKPVLDVMSAYEQEPTPSNRKVCSKQMYAVFAAGKAIDDPADDLFTSFWTMAFDGAILERNKDGAAAVLGAFTKFGDSVRPIHKLLRERMAKELKSFE